MNIKTHISSLFFIAVIAISCCTKKAIVDETDTKTTTTVKETTFDPTGYTEGIIVQSTSKGDCEWTIQLKDGSFIEALKIDEKYLKNGTSIWIKYTLQRRMQRCDKASPAVISEIVLRW